MLHFGVKLWCYGKIKWPIDFQHVLQIKNIAAETRRIIIITPHQVIGFFTINTVVMKRQTSVTAPASILHAVLCLGEHSTCSCVGKKESRSHKNWVVESLASYCKYARSFRRQIFPANLTIGAKHSAFSTSHLADQTKHNYNEQQKNLSNKTQKYT